MSLVESKNQLSPAMKDTLLHIARQSIQKGLEMGTPLTPELGDYAQELGKQRATFVTLQRQHNLRGCIGTLEAHRPLVVDVAENAFAAAFRDPRFAPLKRDELADLHIEISILTAPERVYVDSEQHLLETLQPGVDGLILEEGRNRGTFLPSVWEALPTPQGFLTQLKRKAGLPTDYWSDQLKVWRYTVEKIAEAS